jgi:hypothetical protein
MWQTEMGLHEYVYAVDLSLVGAMRKLTPRLEVAYQFQTPREPNAELCSILDLA